MTPPDQAEQGAASRVVPQPGAVPSSSARHPGDRGQRRGSRSRALSPPLDRSHRSPLSPTPAASEPPFEIEQLRRGAQSGPHQSLRLSATRRDGNRRNRPWRSRLSKIRNPRVAAAVAEPRGRKQLSAMMPWLKDRDIVDGYRRSPHRQRWQAFGPLRCLGHAVARRHFASLLA
jgi:hypothetical protein